MQVPNIAFIARRASAVSHEMVHPFQVQLRVQKIAASESQTAVGCSAEGPGPSETYQACTSNEERSS